MSKFNPQPKPEKKPKLSKMDAWKALKVRAVKKMLDKSKQFVDKDTAFYNEIWQENLHKCYHCGAFLGDTWKKWNFHHLKPKAKFPNLRYEKDNVVLLCLQCHSNEHT